MNESGSAEEEQQPVSEAEQLHMANRDLQDHVAVLRQQLDASEASARLMRESRWWRLGLALRNRRNILFGLRHPIWALKTVAGLRSRRRRGRRGTGGAATTSRQWLAGISASPRSPEDLWIAGIFDADSSRALDPDCNLITFRPDNWQITLEGRRPHFLLVESAERGNDGSWEYKIGTAPHADAAGLSDLRDLVDWCRANGTPTVFWLTASAATADRFAEAASLFDHVIATEPTAALRLQRAGDLRASNVLTVPLGVQPAVHSPIGSDLAPDTCAVLVSGTAEGAEHLLDAAQTFGLTIYTPEGKEETARTGDHVIAVGFRALEQMVSRHAVYVNIDPVGVPSRVLNALASGAVVVSVPNPALEDAFRDIIAFARSSEEAKECFERLLSDDEHRAHVRAAGLHAVLSGHTIRHRLCAIARAAGYELDEEIDARVTQLVLIDDASEAEAFLRTVSHLRPAPTEILVGLGVGAPMLSTEQEESRVRVVLQDGGSDAGERFRALAALARDPWVAPVMQGASIEEISDLVLAHRFARADVIGRGEAFNFTERLDPSGAIARREVVATRAWPPTPQWVREGVRIFTVPR